MKKIKILHLMGKVGSGGIEKFVINVLQNIERKKFQFDIVVFRDEEEFYEEELKIAGSEKIVLDKNLKSNFLRRIERLFKFYKLLRERPDYGIIHAHMSTPLTYFELICVAKLLNRKVVAHSHSSGTWKNGKIRKLCYRIGKRFLWAMTEVHLACSVEAAHWLFPEKYSKYVIIVINGINTDEFLYSETKRNEIRKEYDLNGFYVLGHVGRFQPEKNQKLLIDIVEYLKQRCSVKLLLIGEGKQKSDIENYVKKKNLEDTVLLLGEVHEVNDLMQAMDIFVLPSIYEGFGIVALEAQASGLPCVLSDAVPRKVQCADTVWFIPLSEEVSAWGEKIMSIKNECRTVRSQSSKKMSKVMKTNAYDIRATADEMSEIYCELVETRGGDCPKTKMNVHRN